MPIYVKVALRLFFYVKASYMFVIVVHISSSSSSSSIYRSDPSSSCLNALPILIPQVVQVPQVVVGA